MYMTHHQLAIFHNGVAFIMLGILHLSQSSYRDDYDVPAVKVHATGVTIVARYRSLLRSGSCAGTCALP